MKTVFEVSLYNGESISLSEIPRLAFEAFEKDLLASVKEGCRVAAFFGKENENGEALGVSHSLFAVLADPLSGKFRLFATSVDQNYPSLTLKCPALHLFEREIFENFGVEPLGHPWLKGVRRTGGDEFFRVEGEEIHEVAVGPVHAGVIEPGHFRFQCHGEEVLHLEIALGYQHRGIEKALSGAPRKETLTRVEAVAGDTTIAHALAYCQVLEGLSKRRVPERAEALRAIALELERLANHTGDLGALAGDVGFLPTASYCGRLRGDFLNLTALLCGSRFGRRMLRPGGVFFDLDEARKNEFTKRLEETTVDLRAAVEMLFKTPTAMARFHEAGALSQETALEIGLVGLPARACGLARDARCDFPTGSYRTHPISPSTWPSGNVFARAKVRWLEIQRSIEYLGSLLKALPDGEIFSEPEGALAPASLSLAMVEGWRGEVCHVGLTDERGSFEAYKIVDPSFHNWTGLALALRGQEISDFPLCNKSFNLSYCGHDL